MKKIVIEFIPHNQMRYFSYGDYQEFDDHVLFSIMDTGNDDFNFQVAMHELSEQYLAKKRGIKEEDITAWDLKHLDSEEPGALEGCPYKNEHAFANIIESLIKHEGEK